MGNKGYFYQNSNCSNIVMSPEVKADLKAKIEALIIKYEHDIHETEKSTQPIKPENSLGRISRMDAINNKSVMEASLRNKVSKRNKLKFALTQLDSPGFGNCINCQKIINPKRLMFMPESTKCINCAR